MMSAIQGIMPLTPISPSGSTEQVKSVQGSEVNFSDYLTDALAKVDSLQKEADAASIGLATGEIDDMHTAMVALEKADLSMSLAVEVRNKALDAYHEMMRMQI